MATKLLGQLVGAPLLALQASGSGFVPSIFKDGTDQVLWRDYATTSANLIGDQISMGIFPPNAWFDFNRSRLIYDAFGAGCTVSIGDATYPAALGVRTLTAAGNISMFNQPYGGAGGRLWQRLGYPTDPAREIELLATFGAANPANGNFAWQIYGRRH